MAVKGQNITNFNTQAGDGSYPGHSVTNVPSPPSTQVPNPKRISVEKSPGASNVHSNTGQILTVDNQ